jgi:archaellum component FlaG (FlaF/FlaG flagellin family)
MFVGAVVAAALVAAALGSVAGDYASSVRSRSSGLALDLQSGLQVVNDPAAVANAPFVLYVKNTGTVALDATHLTILLDGVASAAHTTEVGGIAATVIPPGALATVTILDLAPGAGDHHVIVLADHGAQDAFDFAET